MNLYIFCRFGVVILEAPEGYDNPQVFRGMINAMRSDGYFAWTTPLTYIRNEDIMGITLVKQGEQPPVTHSTINERGRPN